ncbi:MAG: polysaccharide biosynthesis/export family protein [Bryobacteraceae bacterium]
MLKLLPLAAILLAPALFAQNREDPPAPVKVEAPKVVPGQVPTAAPAAVDPHTYVVGAEDVLYIRVWREMDFTGQYIVRPDGKITIPLVGDVQASGLTPERLGAQLTQALSDFINKPDVSVSVAQVNSKKYYITGQIFRTGEFPLVVPTRVFDALANGGGFRDFANKKKIVIVRGAQRIKFNYDDIIKGKNLDQNIFLENGDTVVVP